jgi:ankyrin repeat protein/serine/threonine protein kinase
MVRERKDRVHEWRDRQRGRMTVGEGGVDEVDGGGGGGDGRNGHGGDSYGASESMEPYSKWVFDADEEAWLERKVKNDIDHIIEKESPEPQGDSGGETKGADYGDGVLVSNDGGNGGSMTPSVDDGHTNSADRPEAPTAEPLCRFPEQEDANWDRGLHITCYGPLNDVFLIHPDRRLDNGGFGVVYQVQSSSDDNNPILRHYAAKRSKHIASFESPATASVTNTSMTTGGRGELSVAMQEEAQIILQVVPHENILDLVDMAHVKGVPVLITLWGDGGSLDTFLENHATKDGNIGTLSVDVMLGLGIQLCRGLRHLHDSGVVHYDLKPANVIVFTPQSEHNDRNEHVLKVADFGLSRGLKDWLGEGSENEFTSVGGGARDDDSKGDDCSEESTHIAGRWMVNGGTPGYRAPELGMCEEDLARTLLQDSSDHEGAVDVWALGLILGYMLTPSMWRSGRGAWMMADRRRGRELLPASGWDEGIALHREDLLVATEGVVGGTDAASAMLRQVAMTGAVFSCLSRNAVDRPTVKECEEMLGKSYRDGVMGGEGSYPAAAAQTNEGGEVETKMREARFWSYMLGTPDARERACAMWDTLPSSVVAVNSEKHFRMLARCHGSDVRMEQADAALERVYGNSQRKLNNACDLGDDNVSLVRGVKRKLENTIGWHINQASGNDGATPLYVAAQQGHIAVVTMLVKECQADVNQATNNGTTPLIVASSNGHIAVVKVLVKEGQADVNQANDNGVTPLIFAAYNSHIAVVELLVKEGQADVNQARNDGGTPLFAAAQYGHIAVVELLVTEGQADVNHAMNNGGTPLYIAAQNGHIAIVELLVKEGQVDVNQAGNGGATPLLVAALQGRIAVVELLVKEGQADVNQAAKGGGAPLFWAAQNGHTAVVELLVKEGQADVNQANEHGLSPLIMAAQQGHTAVVELLVKEGQADVNQAMNDGRTPLFIAAQDGHIAVVELLVKEGQADVNQARKDGVTPLIMAVQNGHFAVVELLVKEGQADVNQAANDGATPLFMAAYHDHSAVAELLVKGGADIDSVKKFARQKLPAILPKLDMYILTLKMGVDPEMATLVYEANQNDLDRTVKALTDMGCVPTPSAEKQQGAGDKDDGGEEGDRTNAIGDAKDDEVRGHGDGGESLLTAAVWICALCETVNQNNQHTCQCCGALQTEMVTDSCENKEDGHNPAGPALGSHQGTGKSVDEDPPPSISSSNIGLSTSSSDNCLTQWLESLGLGRVHSTLVDLGAERVDDLIDIEAEDIDVLELSDIERSRFMEALRGVKGRITGDDTVCVAGQEIATIENDSAEEDGQSDDEEAILAAAMALSLGTE